MVWFLQHSDQNYLKKKKKLPLIPFFLLMYSSRLKHKIKYFRNKTLVHESPIGNFTTLCAVSVYGNMAASWLELDFRRPWPSDSETPSWRRLQTARDQQVGNGELVKMMMMCFRRISGAANVRWLVSARDAGVCRLDTAAWRHRHTPVAECWRLKEPPLNGSRVFRHKGTDSHVACWSGIPQQLKATHWHAQGTVLSVYRGVHERSVDSFRSLLSSKARGLCSGKAKETPDSSPAADGKEDSPVPGHGLFKFKELVSTELSSRCL